MKYFEFHNDPATLHNVQQSIMTPMRDDRIKLLGWMKQYREPLIKECLIENRTEYRKFRNRLRDLTKTI